MPVTAADLQELKALVSALTKTLDAKLAQLQVEETTNLRGDYPAARTLTRKT